MSRAFRRASVWTASMVMVPASIEGRPAGHGSVASWSGIGGIGHGENEFPADRAARDGVDQCIEKTVLVVALGGSEDCTACTGTAAHRIAVVSPLALVARKALRPR